MWVVSRYPHCPVSVTQAQHRGRLLLPPYTRSICVFTTADGLQMCPLPWAVLLGAQLPAGQPCLGDSSALQPPCLSTCCRRWPLIRHMRSCTHSVCALSVYSADPQCGFTQPQRALRVQTRLRLRASDTFSLLRALSGRAAAPQLPGKALSEWSQYLQSESVV